MWILPWFQTLLQHLLHNIHISFGSTVGLLVIRTAEDMSKPITLTECSEFFRCVLCPIVWDDCIRYPVLTEYGTQTVYHAQSRCWTQLSDNRVATEVINHYDVALSFPLEKIGTNDFPWLFCLNMDDWLLLLGFLVMLTHTALWYHYINVLVDAIPEHWGSSTKATFFDGLLCFMDKLQDFLFHALWYNNT